MPDLKQIERVVQILQRLSLSRHLTVNELYRFFECQVPKRTLQRDLTVLSSAGIPLESVQGQGRELVWKLSHGSLKFIPQTLGSQELLASFFLERLAVVAKGTRLEKDIQSLLKKARQLTGPTVFHSTDGTEFTHDMFGATFMGYIDYSDHSEKIDLLLQAASECCRCRFVYRRATADSDSEFDADPYLLLYHKGALYAVVYVENHDNYIFLPIQRIRRIETTGETFVRDESFSIEQLRDGRFGIFGGPELKPEKVVLKFSPGIAEVVEERIWHPSQELMRNRDGSLTLTITSVVSDELRAWVGSWLSHVEVIKPRDLLTQR